MYNNYKENDLATVALCSIVIIFIYLFTEISENNIYLPM